MPETNTLKDKSAFLYRLGFLQDKDRSDWVRVEARWTLYQTTPQKTARSSKKEAEAA